MTGLFSLKISICKELPPMFFPRRQYSAPTKSALHAMNRQQYNICLKEQHKEIQEELGLEKNSHGDIEELADFLRAVLKASSANCYRDVATLAFGD